MSRNILDEYGDIEGKTLQKKKDRNQFMVIRKYKLFIPLIFSIIVILVLFLSIQRAEWFKKNNTGEVKEYKTKIETYAPKEIPSEIQKGKCWTTSLASPFNSNAWRCMTGNYIHDPCFEIKGGKIICNVTPGNEKQGFQLSLEEKLPERNSDNMGKGWRYYSQKNPQEENDYWILELENGYKCFAMTGTPPFINNQSFYYYCLDKNDRDVNKYAGEVSKTNTVWTTVIAPGDYAEKQNVDRSKFEEVKISRVWK